MNRTFNCMIVAGLMCATPQAVDAQPGMAPGQPAPPSTEPMQPGTQPMQGQGQGQMQHPTPPQQETQLKYEGKVSDVWSAKVDKEAKHDNKIVLIETDQGQIVLADLGPSDGMDVKVKEGTPVMVTGTMMYMEESNNRRFVPSEINVGKHAVQTSAAQMKPSKQAAIPQKQNVSGKIVEKKEMNAKQTKVDHELMLVEIDPQTRVVVDLGPSNLLKDIDLDKGDKVRVEGHRTMVNQREVLIADKLQAGGKDMEIQRSALPPSSATKQMPPVPGTVPGQPAQPPLQPMPTP